MKNDDIEALIETDLAGANHALANGWRLMAVTHTSSPQVPGQTQTVYVMGKPMGQAAPALATGLGLDRMALEAVVDYLHEHELKLSTAESCTAGQMVALLASVSGAGTCVESGYVVYSPDAKKRLLGVSEQTVQRFGLTSVELAREMAVGALQQGPADIAVATTGVAGPEPMAGVEPGTVCIAWAFSVGDDIRVFSETVRFSGNRAVVINTASFYGLVQIPRLHEGL
ncbi:CinA family protein [Pseudomonas sp. URIL14HWK12:I9]|uniref:CinA family protein n=1 Tax=unclassified Pseudomonas TaxID=196821 RepID=UPI000BD1BCDE|nr:PncC family amidohydrolase [Pseudomonas sp. URIL14HWK12:I12]PVZ22846.1 PncC family amidohydrolase [Pseudomonas sp. URIL14HWK12:I10]PVZ37524.1 PncC family amidohydrolase [Pseudomonas sp. URIL14HWK12:I11]SNZ15001.1 amidohydrolase, PncC family [Pseudomonas sp. URIL14HWK12:I9]